MAEAETVDILELEIKAKAESAASEISSLASSVSDFGKNVRRYINNLNDFSSALTAIADAANKLSNTRGLGKVLEKVAPVAAAMKAKMPTATVRAAQADWRKKMFPNEKDYNAVFHPRGYNAGRAPARIIRVGNDSPYVMDRNDVSKAGAHRLTQQLYKDYNIRASRGFTKKDMDAQIAAIRSGYGRTTGANSAWMTKDSFTALQGLAESIYNASEPHHDYDAVGAIKAIGKDLRFSSDDDMTDVKIGALNKEFADVGIRFSKSGGVSIEDLLDMARGYSATGASAFRDEDNAAAIALGLGENDTMNDVVAKLRSARERKEYTKEGIMKSLLSQIADVSARNEREMVDPEAVRTQEGLKEIWEKNQKTAQSTSQVAEVKQEAEQVVAEIKEAVAETVRVDGDAATKALREHSNAAEIESIKRAAEAADAEMARTNLQRALDNNTPELIAASRSRFASAGRLEAWNDLFGAGVPGLADRGLAAGLIDESTAQAMKDAAAGTQEIGEAANDAKESTDALKDSMEEVAEAEENATTEARSLKDILKAAGSVIGNSFLGKMSGQIFRVAKMRSLRYIVKEIAAGFKEGTSNLYQWSKGLGGPFAAAMDTIASKAMLAKNSIATAFAPAIQALVPVLNTVVNWINAASNALAQFLALLTGKDSWTAAKESAEDWGDATKGSVGGASKAMKDLLADWDELNIIQSETGGGGGGGSGKKSTDVSDMFEERFKFDEWTRYFDDIKKIVLAIGAGIAAWFVVDTAQEFLKKLGIAGETVDGIFSRIKKGIAGAVLLAVGFQLSQTAGKMYANGGFSWAAFATQAIGVIASGIGGVMLASAFGANPVIGLVMGIGLSLVGTIAAYNWQRNENARDYIKKRLESEVYGFDVHALVEQFDIQTKNAQDARDAVTAQLEKTLGDVNVLKLGIDKKKSWDAIYHDVLDEGGLMSSIRNSLEQDSNVVTMYYQIREKLGGGLSAQDEEGNYVNLEAFKIDTKVQQMLTGAYEDLGKRFAECFTDAELKELDAGKEKIAMGILEQITDAQNAAERARGRAEARVAMQEALNGTDAETVLKNFPDVVKEQEKAQADLLRKNDQEYYATQIGIYEELLRLGSDPNGKEMKGLKANIDEAWARITANEYELDVHAKFAEDTAELFGSFLTEHLNELKPTEIAEVYKALFPDGEVDISKILDENGLKKLREKVSDEYKAGLELDDNVKMTDEFLNEKMSELFGITKVSGPTQEELDFIREGVEEEFEGDPILLKAYVDADDEDLYIEEYQEGPSFNPSIGNTGWAAGQTASEETFEMDAGGSGLATDDAVNGAAADVTSGMAKLENVMGLVKTAVDLVAEYTRMTANKDFTVTINPSAAFGRVGNTSGRMYGNVTGD